MPSSVMPRLTNGSASLAVSATIRMSAGRIMVICGTVWRQPRALVRVSPPHTLTPTPTAFPLMAAMTTARMGARTISQSWPGEKKQESDARFRQRRTAPEA